MSDNHPTISVCIPTWNRSKYLKECLDSIVCQFSDESVYNKVEIVISDNASNDDTEVVVNKYQAKFNNIYYSKNDINIGFSRNVEKVIDCAHGKYVWLLGDDDIVVVDSLKVLLNKTNNKEYAAILLNFYHGECYNPRIKIFRNGLYFRDKEYLDSKSFFCGKDFTNYNNINVLSVIVLNRSVYQQNKIAITKYLDTFYYQSYAFLITAICGTVLRTAKVMVGYRRQFTRKVQDEEEAFNRDLPSLEIAISQANDFKKYAVEIGYYSDNYLPSKNYIRSLVSVIIHLLIKYHLIKFARFFYRIPRLLMYQAQGIKTAVFNKYKDINE
ncbi:MAG: glycosyltransferase family 2 protein [Candidatus Falkowbacteria bacterium]